MEILIVHNYYQQAGGDVRVFNAEANLLEAQGHQVLRYIVHNNDIANINPMTLAGITVWNRTIYRELRQLLNQKKPQIVHFHNSFPLISPAAYYAVRAEGIPVVQTLHNYRLLCPNACFFRDGQVCEDCLGKFVPWPSVVHACYRGSRATTGTVAAMLTVHGVLQTWTEAVDIYIALTKFAQQKFIQGGLPTEKIVVKPNFVYPDPGSGEGLGGYALFVGRLSPEKGTGTLLTAWEKLNGLPLKIVGDGPLAPQVAKHVGRVPGVEWLGRKSLDEVYELMGNALMLILPSEWYETFGLVAVEAFAKGIPVIAANIGAVAELVESGRTGLKFRPGDPEDLASKVEWALTHPDMLARMRLEARSEFEAKYTAEQNYQMLMDIYEKVLGSSIKVNAK